MSDVEETMRTALQKIANDPYQHGQRVQKMKAIASAALEATPKPDSPVCVEVKELEWQETGVGMWSADVSVGVYTIIQNSFAHFSCWYGAKSISPPIGHPTLEAAQAACQAAFTRRALELINARSVESVRVERDRELEPVFAALQKHHDQALRVGSVIFPAEPDMPEPVEIDLSEAYADSSVHEETVAALALRSLTEGEG